MKPNAKMLGRETFLDGAQDLALEGRRTAPAAAAPDARADSTQARIAVVNRVAAVARALETMSEPPMLGVRTKDNENRPSKQRWDSARKVAFERIHELHTRLKNTLAPNDGPNPVPGPPPPPLPHPGPHPGPAPMPGPQVRSKLDEDELNAELARLKEALDKHKPGKPEK